MSVALHGNLRDFGIGEVFQLISQQQKTGLLEVTDESQRLRITFDGGAVVTGERVGAYEQASLGEMLVRTGSITPQRLVEIEQQIASRGAKLEALLRDGGELRADQLDEIVDLVTRETLLELLRWTRGSFHFSAGPVVHGRRPEQCIPAEQILMDGLRMLDEWQSFAHAVPSEDLVFEPAGDFAAWRASAGPGAVPAQALERVFLLLDGRSSVRRVIDRSRLGTFDAVRALAELRRAGLAAPLAPVRAAARAPAAAAHPGRGVARAAATALPLLLLALAAGAALLSRRAPATPGFPIARSPLAEARAASATRRVRHALEAVRFQTGAWPASLDAGAMAAPGGRPYYYARRGDGALVLAPER
jgi:hypothetical protein